MILSTRLNNKKSGARRQSALSSLGASRIQRPRFKRRLGNQLRQIGTSSMTTRSSGLALSEMRTTKPKESAWSSVAIRNRSIPPRAESDLVTDLYSASTPIANMDRSDCYISFNRLNKFVISLSTTIGALSSPLGSYSESDLETDLYSGYTPIAIKMSLIVGWLCPSSQLWWDEFIWLQRPLQVIKHLADLSLSWAQLTQ
jgi:hypothetical protein